MKNNIEKVYGKLPKKVNLKNHKVELESVQELKNQINLITNSNLLAEEVIENYNQSLREANSFYTEFNRIYENFINVAFDVLKKAEDLGVDIPEVSESDLLADRSDFLLQEIGRIANREYSRNS